MGRAPCCDKVGLKKGRWTTDEDRILINYIKQNGEGSWRSMPKNAGLLRCGKSCRLRWINYLRSDLKRGNFTTQEQDIIIKLHASLGNKWSLIANQLPGRTDNEIKNYWNSSLSRRIDTFRKPNIISSSSSTVAGILPQLDVTTSSNLGQMIMNAPAGTVDVVTDDNNVKKKKGRGRTSRAAMKKNKNIVTNYKPNKPKQVVTQHQHASKSISSNSSCLSRCQSATSVGNCSFTVLTLPPQTPTLEHAEVMESLLLDTSLATKKGEHAEDDELVDLDAFCTEGVELSFGDNNTNNVTHFYDKLVVELDGINRGDEEMRLESMLSQDSGFEDCALASVDWEWENIAHQHADDHNQQWGVNQQNGTATTASSWLWDYYNNTPDHQQDSNFHMVDKNQKEAVVAWLLS